MDAAQLSRQELDNASAAENARKGIPNPPRLDQPQQLTEKIAAAEAGELVRFLDTNFPERFPDAFPTEREYCVYSGIRKTIKIIRDHYNLK